MGADGPRSRGGSPGCQPVEGLGCHQEAAGLWQPQAHGEGRRLTACEADLTVRGGGHYLAPQAAGLPRGRLATTAERTPREAEIRVTRPQARGPQGDGDHPPRGPRKEPAPAPRTVSAASSFRTEVPADND